MSKYCGYMGKLLRIDMTAKKVSDFPLSDELLEKYFGGLTLGARLLLDLVPPKCDELGPDNKLIMTTGPATGTVAFASSLVNVTTKSPLYHGTIASQMNGFLGKHIKCAGYDGFIIEGQAAEWTYITIVDSTVEFHDAKDLLGKDCFETEALLKEKAGQPKASVFCIGPAGEHLVKYAAIEADKGHYASTGGTGTVMGSKKLKGVLVMGTGKVSVADQAALIAANKALKEKLDADPATQAYKVAGTSSTFIGLSKAAMVPIKNLQVNDWEFIDNYDGIKFHTQDPTVKFTHEACYACPIAHCSSFEILEGKHKGLTGDEAEYEGYCEFGSNLLIPDYKDALYLNNINDLMGMDLKECGFTLSWAMEAYQKGYLTKEDTDGIDLTWGNVEAVAKVLEKIAHRDGKFGNLLADGVYLASKNTGPEAFKLGVWGKRHAPHGHDPRTGLGLAFGQAVTDTGSMSGGDTRKPQPECGVPVPPPGSDFAAGQYASAKVSKLTQWRDSMLMCSFIERVAPPAIPVAIQNAVTGANLSVQDAVDIGDRGNHLLRTFFLLAGNTPEDDNISYRLQWDAQHGGPMAGVIMGQLFDAMKYAWYDGMGWDKWTSKPLPESLKKVGLDDLIPKLW
jgi:aldehyde:ferredoxin oxidoreductase